METRQLRHFLSVVEHGSVTAAAAALYLAQPSLSQSLRALEDELGVELFVRERRGMVLSAAGAALLESARQAVRSAEEADGAVLEVVRLESGRLEVAVPADLAAGPLVPIVARFRALYPGVVVSLVDASSPGSTVGLLQDGRCEIGLDYLPAGDMRVEARALGRERALLAVPSDLAAAGIAEPVPFAVMAGLPLVTGALGSPSRAHLERLSAECAVPLRIVAEADHEHGVFLLVTSGAGAGLLSEEVAERARRRGAVVLRTDPECSRSYGLVTRSDRLSPAARAFSDVATAVAGEG
ncbi:LysR family transcriptional regulator [Brevibacterium album]|uniref:LysR family transcriptional regulator n=1 Tax=Brevibacterium album TaxID=417948 RepID=UPI00040854B6|nr:LysR family transcriptional regulator [Brevibacterium album]